MIKEIKDFRSSLIIDFLKGDIARNYFILLGLYGKKDAFDKIYGEFQNDRLIGLLFRRKSGTLQFYSNGEFNIDGFVNIMEEIDYNGLIGPKSYCDNFLNKGIFSSVKEGAYISRLDNRHLVENIESKNLEELKIDKLDEVVEIYKEVFTGFSSKEIMEEKLITKRGRGIYYKENEKILSVAQTEFETEKAAVIVGVATRKDHRHKGLASLCIINLISQLKNEAKDIFLQYDNLEAGKIYERLGFIPIDRVMHYTK